MCNPFNLDIAALKLFFHSGGFNVLIMTTIDCYLIALYHIYPINCLYLPYQYRPRCIVNQFPSLLSDWNGSIDWIIRGESFLKCSTLSELDFYQSFFFCSIAKAHFNFVRNFVSSRKIIRIDNKYYIFFIFLKLFSGSSFLKCTSQMFIVIIWRPITGTYILKMQSYVLY
jgi:hypothetical protein